LSPKARRSILQRREWTYVLDQLILCFLSFLVGLFVGTASGSRASPAAAESAASTAFMLGLLLSTAYCLSKDAFFGKGLGKAMTGLRVVDAVTGEPIGLGKSVARNWIFMVPFFPLVELIVANCRQDKRRLGDLMAGTTVIRD
jgi:uncharacterized RDD family membrane protein YckC